jgi:putative oxidoreductase
MKKFLSADRPLANRDSLVLFLRITISALMLSHGIPKLISLLSGNIQFASVFGLGPDLSLSLAVFAEVVCSIFILFGLGIRFAVIPLIITMLIAVFHIHVTDPFAKQELGLFYLVGYVILFFTGSGRYSLDYHIQRRPTYTKAIEKHRISARQTVRHG